jgi:hypothetical protein
MADPQAKMDAAHLGIEIVNSARRWMRLRARLRLLLDSKTAQPSAVEKVRVAYNKESHELELLVAKLEKTLLLNGQELITLLARAGADGLSEALNPEQAQPRPPPVQNRKNDDVIDAEIEED